MKQDITKTITNYAEQAYRNITVAYKDVPLEEFQKKDLNSQEDVDWLENDLTFLAIFGIQDPLRPEIKNSIKVCGEAGITVRMVTGDNIETARAIALDAGILT